MELILGHNQFIGVSHISEERAREREKTFSKVENIYRVVEAASAVGLTDMIIETHPRAFSTSSAIISVRRPSI